MIEDGQFHPPHHIFSTWVVKAWNKPPEELIRKYWDVCVYKNIGDLQNLEGSINQSIAEFYRARIVQMMESTGIPEAITSLDDPENNIDDPDTKDPPEGTCDTTTKS